MPAGTVFLVMVGVLGLAALLNAERMLHRAETSELGTRRDVALGFWRPVSSLSSSLGLGFPRAGVEAVRDLGDDGGQGVEVVASGRGGRLGHEPFDPNSSPSPSGTTPSGSSPPAAPTTADPSSTAPGAEGAEDPGAIGAPTNGTTDPATGTPNNGTTDPATGTPNNGTTDPATGAPSNGTTDPATGEPVGGSAEPGPGETAGRHPSSGGPAGGPEPGSAGPLQPEPIPPADRTSGVGPPLGLPPPSPGGQSPDQATTEPSGSPAGPGPDTESAAPTDPTAASGTGPAEDASAFPLRRPTVDDPLRILIVGDSTMDAVGTSMARDLAETGLTDVELDVRVSTGLSRPDFFDWPTNLRQRRAELGTEVVVIMIGANDAQPFIVGNTAVAFGTEAWFATYRQRVAALIDELTADGHWVFWIGQPSMRNDELDTKMQQLNQVYAEEVERSERAIFIDSRAVTTDENGDYAAYLPLGDTQQLIRQADGVHLTPDGGDRLSPVIIEELNAIAPLY